jgi:manganese-dependent ADP-ribose/CDP-alcohol diphosphatase
MAGASMNRRRFIALSAAASVTQSVAEAAAPREKPLLSFGLITDVQYADADPAGERHFRESIPKLKAAVADLGAENLPFTLHLGDVIDRDFASFAEILPHFAPLGHPVRHLLGNHEFSVKPAEKVKVAAALGMPADYYAFAQSGVRFLMLDTNELSTYKPAKGSALEAEAKRLLERLAAAGADNAKPWNGGVSKAQLAWIGDQLEAADETEEPVIVCGHHPLLPEDGHQAWNHRELLDLLGRHRCVRAYFNGHYHDGAEAIEKGIPFITLKSLLHEPGVTAYSVVRLFDDRLEIAGRGRERSRVVALRA